MNFRAEQSVWEKLLNALLLRVGEVEKSRSPRRIMTTTFFKFRWQQLHLCFVLRQLKMSNDRMTEMSNFLTFTLTQWRGEGWRLPGRKYGHFCENSVKIWRAKRQSTLVCIVHEFLACLYFSTPREAISLSLLLAVFSDPEKLFDPSKYHP